jgi:CHAT domain-containing protein
VVAWYTTPERCISFLLRSGTREVLSVSAPVGWADLAGYVDLAAVDLWRQPSSPRQQVSAAWTRLMDQLVPPQWADHLAAAHDVTLLPHGLLHELPLHALPLTAAAGHTLTDIGIVRHLPGLSFAGSLRSRRLTPDESAKPSVFAYSGGADGHFSAEAVAIAGNLGVSPYLDDAASCEELVRLAPASSLIHIAAHGWFDAGDPLGSAVRLADGVLTARDVVERILLNRATVVLSGCETSRRAVSPLDESEGLVRAFFVAGANAVIASQWAVDSAATRALMERVYLRSHEQGIDAALRDSMLEQRSRYPHPYYWAPFVYWGEGPVHD